MNVQNNNINNNVNNTSKVYVGREHSLYKKGSKIMPLL